MMKKASFRFFSQGKDVNTDESLVFFTGRLSFQQYINLREQGFALKTLPIVYI